MSRFARRMGETWLRPDYCNPIEHYAPRAERVGGVLLAVVIGCSLAAVLFLGWSA